MIARLFLLFTITTIVELALLMRLGEIMGLWPTLALIVGTGLLGSYLAKREGLAVWNKLNSRIRSAELPSHELVDGVIILIAGAFLLTPGVLTDLVGFLGLLPPSRAVIRNVALKKLDKVIAKPQIQFGFTSFGTPPVSSDTSPDWQGHAADTPQHARPDSAPES